LSDKRVALIGRGEARLMVIDRDDKGVWNPNYALDNGTARPDTMLTIDDIEKAAVEVRPVQRRQIYVGGKPVGGNFE
jgi:hypothetical protein